MGQRPSFSHLTGYPEAVASAQDFAPYGHTENVLAPAEGLPPSTAQIAGFVHGIRILLFARVGVYCRFVNGTASATRAPCEQSP